MHIKSVDSQNRFLLNYRNVAVVGISKAAMYEHKVSTNTGKSWKSLYEAIKDQIGPLHRDTYFFTNVHETIKGLTTTYLRNWILQYEPAIKQSIKTHVKTSTESTRRLTEYFRTITYRRRKRSKVAKNQSIHSIAQHNVHLAKCFHPKVIKSHRKRQAKHLLGGRKPHRPPKPKGSQSLSHGGNRKIISLPS